MHEPFANQVVITAREVAHMLSMDMRTLARLREEDPSFPQPILLGRAPAKKVGARLRWRKDEVLAWLLIQKPPPPAEKPPKTADK